MYSLSLILVMTMNTIGHCLASFALNIDVERFRNMKVNPFDMNNMQQNNFLNDIVFEDNIQYISHGEINYIFPEEFFWKI